MSRAIGGLPDTHRGSVILGRRLVRARDGLVGLAQSFSGTGDRTVVTSRAAVLAVVEVQQGTVSFPLATGEVEAPSRFVLALPPRSVLPLRLVEAHVDSVGCAAFSAVTVDRTSIRDATGLAPPLDRRTAREAASAPILLALDADAGAPGWVPVARRRLHELLGDPAPVRRVAREAEVTPETLSRAFVRTYGLAPKQYCHRARLFDAVLRLLDGKGILESALDTGFHDLTRFYVQFRRLIGTTPGAYADVRKRQDRGP